MKISLEFVSTDIASTWPSGISVLIRRVANNGRVKYEVDNWFRGDLLVDQKKWQRYGWKSILYARIIESVE